MEYPTLVRSDLRRRRGLFVLLACSCLTAAVALAGSSTGTASANSRTHLASPRRYQSVLFWLGWGGGNPNTIPWGAVTQVDLFSLSTCARKGRPAPDCAGPRSLSTKFNGLSSVGRFVRSVHRHHKLALISIGGSDNPNWYYACNPSNVATSARNLVRYMKSNGFDGIDLDIDAGTGKPILTAADLRACTRTVHDDAKAIKTRRGTVPLITSDVDPTTDFDIGRIQKRHVDQFNAMSYGASGTALAAQIATLEKNSQIPASKITAGLDIGDYPQPQSDCAGTAAYAATHHLAGAMLWFGQADAPSYACLQAIAQYVP